MGIRTSKQDYTYAIEGVSYALAILKNKRVWLEDIIITLKNPEVMGGETGEEYCKKLSQSVEVIDSAIKKFELFTNKVVEVCNQNGAYVENTIMDDFAQIERAFATKAEQISRFNGKTMA